MSKASLIVGNSNWAIKDSSLLGYNINDSNIYSPFPFDVTRATPATRVDKDGLIVTDTEILSGDLVTNGSFATDTDWTKGTGITISGGKANFTGNANTFLTQSGVVSSNKTYKATFTVSNYVSGAIDINLGGSTRQGNISANGTYTFYVTVPSGNVLFFQEDFSNGFIGSIDNVSLVEVNRNNLARIDYLDSTKGVLLTEPQSTNLVLNSEPTSNENAADNITYESFSWDIGFDNCVAFGDNSSLRYRYGGSVTSGTEYTLSAYILMDDNSEPIVSDSTSSGDFSLNIGNAIGGGTINASVSMGNNIWRISKTKVSTQTSTNNGIIKYTTQSSKGFKVVGWQLEQKSFATSYIPTSGSTVTRNQDLVTNGGEVSTFNSEEGVLFVEVSNVPESSVNIISLTDGTNAERVMIYFNLDSTLQFYIRVSSVYLAIVTVPSNQINFEDTNKIAIKYKTDDMSFWLNGTKVDTITSGTMFAPNTLNQLGLNSGLGGQFYGKTKNIQVFKKALTDAELIKLTTI